MSSSGEKSHRLVSAVFFLAKGIGEDRPSAKQLRTEMLDLGDLNDVLERCPSAYIVRKSEMDDSDEVRTEWCPSPVGERELSRWLHSDHWTMSSFFKDVSRFDNPMCDGVYLPIRSPVWIIVFIPHMLIFTVGKWDSNGLFVDWNAHSSWPNEYLIDRSLLCKTELFVFPHHWHDMQDKGTAHSSSNLMIHLCFFCFSIFLKLRKFQIIKHSNVCENREREREGSVEQRRK